MADAKLTIDPTHAAYARALAPFVTAMGGWVDELILIEVFLRLRGGAPRPVVGAAGRAEARVADVMRGSMATADVLGRREVLAAANVPARPPGPPPPPTAPGASGLPVDPDGIPNVPFTEAVADVIAREPRLARTVGDVARAYNERHGFALARSTRPETTTRVQKAVSAAIRSGQSSSDAVASIQAVARAAGEDMAAWTEAYAETVFRTSMNTAYSAGRFRQMADPSVSQVIGALRFTAVGDADTRPNHAAADGMIAGPMDSVWQALAPPLGFNCRCTLDFVTWGELDRMGLAHDGIVRPARHPSGAHADSGFRHTGRPDQLIYGGAV